jgi:hypothetical protein
LGVEFGIVSGVVVAFGQELKRCFSVIPAPLVYALDVIPEVT